MGQKVFLNQLSPYMIKLLSEGIDVSFTVNGNSMFPLFEHKKTKVTITKPTIDNIKKGDIPLYQRENGQFVLHRIVKIKNGQLIITGDAQTLLEYGIKKSSILGIVKSFSYKNKIIDVSNLYYRLYSLFWMHIIPLRPLIIRIIKKWAALRGKNEK